MILRYKFVRNLLYEYLDFQDLLQIRGSNKTLKKECIPFVAKCFKPTTAMYATASILQWILHEVIYENQRRKNEHLFPFLFVRSAIACDKTDFVLQVPYSAIWVGYAWYNGNVNPKNYRMLKFLAQHPASLVFKDSMQHFALHHGIPFLLDYCGPVNASWNLNWRIMHELKFQLPQICRFINTGPFLTRLYCNVQRTKVFFFLDNVAFIALAPLICLGYANFVEVIYHILLRETAILLFTVLLLIAPKKIFRDLRYFGIVFAAFIFVFLSLAPYITTYILVYILCDIGRLALFDTLHKLRRSDTHISPVVLFGALRVSLDYAITSTWLI